MVEALLVGLPLLLLGGTAVLYGVVLLGRLLRPFKGPVGEKEGTPAGTVIDEKPE